MGEGLDKRDLFVRKRPDTLQVINDHNAQQVVAFEDRHRKHCAHALKIFCSIGKFWINLDILDLDGPAFERCAGSSAVATRSNGIFCDPLCKFWRRGVGDRQLEQLTIEAENES